VRAPDCRGRVTPIRPREVSRVPNLPGAGLAEIAQHHGRTCARVILNFLTRDEHVFTIPKASAATNGGNAGGMGLDAPRPRTSPPSIGFPPRRDVPLAML